MIHLLLCNNAIHCWCNFNVKITHLEKWDLTWWTGKNEMYVSGLPDFIAFRTSMQAARNWKGSSALIHHRLPSKGRSADSKTWSIQLSICATRASKDNLLIEPPKRFASCILSQRSPVRPSGLPSANSSIPRQKSDPKWFKFGCIGYALPRKSRLWG